MEAVVHEMILDERLGALEGARAWSPRVISKLESHIRTADDVALFRINPIRFAAEKNIAEAEAIDLFLHGAFLGLFEMDWLLLCSACSCVVESFGSLKGVRNQFHCAMCRTDLEAALDDYIAVAFTVSPQIRSITFHRPETEPHWDSRRLQPLTGWSHDEANTPVFTRGPRARGPDGFRAPQRVRLPV
jgi:hypothetical protein